MAVSAEPTTPSPQAAASAVVAALEQAWTAIRAHHSDVPEVVVILGAGSEARRGLFKWGHFAAARWHVAGANRPEVLVSGEGLNRGARPVLATLLHEAAHGLANTRQIKDTSRQGRWHNQRFRTLASELLWRHAERQHGPATGSRNLLACSCACGRKLRVARATLEQAPIICGGCDQRFEPERALTLSGQRAAWLDLDERRVGDASTSRALPERHPQPGTRPEQPSTAWPDPERQRPAREGGRER